MLRTPSLRSHSIFYYNIRRFCSKPIFITTPIFYVNDKPHIGHLYTSLLADSLSRWFKVNGKKVLFSTGTDEHGLKIQKEAKSRNINEIQHCDKHSSQFKELFDTFNIQYDRFIRTTEDSHIKSAKHLWSILDQNGFITKGEYSGWYSTTDEEFLTDSDINIDSNGIVTSKNTGSIVEKTQEENYLFNMEKIRNKLLSWVSSGDSSIEPKEKINQVIHCIKNITNELSISRDMERVHWGIQCPSDNTQTMYVWLDALSNYLTVAGYPDKSFLNVWPPDYQILGKDIINFHCVYWPAFLLASNIPLPKRFICHAHWTKDRVKMSKSLKNIVDPVECLKEYSVDMIRFYLLLEGGMENDGDFSFTTLDARVNGDLCNHYKI